MSITAKIEKADASHPNMNIYVYTYTDLTWDEFQKKFFKEMRSYYGDRNGLEINYSPDLWRFEITGDKGKEKFETDKTVDAYASLKVYPLEGALTMVLGG